ncbi:binding-protein-dependent transport systems inner membrane component [Allomeiothermus silvanus DSM 9946]|uniref:Binding-protein-dependent transport systems inner membrane component n=1 Tax=Allomeiothermus silvanus (strain ATCC 700542 / DSM 9946 / NBRC 106475 / NCIMB 13440 / VI-R2) TaxID=526227 RepID=D7BGU7_ALLS1|nr:carbohydrate ABC transporter permease [Allomeiothermus silvanus]ADH62101.1 binding-protein-dependent transport systems inner membrane component [Allomeiothermus silvanus DSM 9946]
MSEGKRVRWELTLLAYLVAGVMFFPIFWMFLTGFKSEGDAIAIPPKLLFTPTLESIREALTRSDYAQHFLNSLISALGSTALALLLAIPAAYSMAFYPTQRTNSTLLWMISTKMMPPVGVIIPVYLIFRDLRWLDNVWALALMYTVMNLPVVVWTLFAYFREIPQEMMEAARVDGASIAQEVTRVLLPVSGLAVASAALLSIILAWNEAFWSLNLTSAHASPLSVYVASFKTAEGLFWAKMSAASMIAIFPVMVMGWLAQRQLVRGLTFGAIK